tara:strand:+ start:20254 stop:20865 length:612 start_codon:yes stop_codon:yes gene_type:complete
MTDTIAEATSHPVPDWVAGSGSDEINELVERQRGIVRNDLPYSDLSDFALANAVFLVDRLDLELIHYTTAAKERIRWLSVQLADALARERVHANPAPDELVKAARDVMEHFAGLLHDGGEEDQTPDVALALHRALAIKPRTEAEVEKALMERLAMKAQALGETASFQYQTRGDGYLTDDGMNLFCAGWENLSRWLRSQGGEDE